MLVLLSSIALVVGTALVIASMRITTTVNEGIHIPFWGRPKRDPGRAMATRAFGLGAAAMGATTLAAQVGPWAVALLLPAVITIFTAIPLHNRRVNASGGVPRSR